ncbi:MAG TPA: MOSC domain-containing protein [Gaiellaceae bacterium]|nr:MOSC domain-containing protein [Gaiellaceae bacterium]
MIVESVNAAHDSRVLRVGAREVTTGIAKLPVGRARIGVLGLEGDVVADQENHGGADQAVYLYSREDYAWWEAETGEPHPAGTFGENVTVSDFGGEVRVGDRFRVGGVLLEATAPRIPCGVFAAHVRRAEWVKRFAASRRVGVYTRVLEPGEVAAGDAVEHLGGGDGHPTIAELVDVWYAQDTAPEVLERALRAPLAARLRAALERRLARAAA